MAGDKFNVASQLTRNEVFGLVFRLTLFGALTYFGIKWMVNAIDPTKKQKVDAQKRAERILNRIGVKDVKLTEYELSIAAQLVDPTSIGITWTDIAGLDDVIQEMRETVIVPIEKRELFAGCQLIQPPKGVLLHGPPGCGKTMIAKATAKEAGARFINLEVSALTDKWYGESQKLAAAVFTLALKIQPCIVFIDEIDSFLRSRDSHDHEATAMMKAQFMSLWDGLITDPTCQVVVMGATNRPQDVDRAILRRMPAMFHIGLPNRHQREGILRLILENEITKEDEIDLERLGRSTEGFSGSDLRELCRNAALYRVRDYLKDEQASADAAKNASINGGKEAEDESDGEGGGERFHDALRPFIMDDFLKALSKMKESKVASGALLKHTGIDLD